MFYNNVYGSQDTYSPYLVYSEMQVISSFILEGKVPG
jgi:hypothetical protein